MELSKVFSSPYSFVEKFDFVRNRLFPPYGREYIIDTAKVSLKGRFKPLRLAFLGDLMPINDLELALDSELQSMLDEVDILVVNLEGIITERRRPFALSHNKSIIRKLNSTFLGMRVIVNTVNNHSNDFGIDEYQRHIALLSQEYDVITCEKHHIVVDGLVELCALTEWSNQDASYLPYLHYETVPSRVTTGMYSILLPHWGYEMHLSPRENQRRWSRDALLQGWDAVIGVHSHSPQMIEVVQGHPLVYSLGNLAYNNVSPNHKFGQLVVLNLSEEPSIECCYIKHELSRNTLWVKAVDTPSYSIARNLRTWFSPINWKDILT